MQTSNMSEPEAESDKDAAAPKPSAFYAWYVVGILVLLSLFSWLDRQIIVLLIDPIKQDLGISEVQIGLLTGSAFAVLYAVMGFPLGWAVDRYNRRNIIALGVMVWSLATIFCGLARSFGQLFAARVGVGVGEAALSPATSSILSDLFPPHRLSLANSAIGMGAALGGGISFVVGGLVAATVSHGELVHVPLIGEIRAWQVAFLIVGIPGPFLALLALTIREPARTGRAKKIVTSAGVESPVRFLAFLKSNWQFFTLMISGFALIIMGNYAVQVWGPSYLSRVFGWDAAQIGTSFGTALAIPMIISLFVAGTVIDRLYGRGMKDAHLRVFALVAVLCVPVMVGAIALDNGWAFIGGVFFFKLLIGGAGPIAVACLQIVTPNEFRGRMVALLLFVLMLGGLGLGPVMVASLTQYVFMDMKMVGWSVATVFTIIYPMAAILLWLGMRYQRRMLIDHHAPV